MNERVLDIAMNRISNKIEMPRVEVTDASVASQNIGVSVAARHVGTKNLKTKRESVKQKYVCSTRKNPENITKQKDDTSPMAADKNTKVSEQKKTPRKSPKRKTSDSGTESEKDDDASPMNVDENANDFEQSKNVSAKYPERKTATKNLFADVIESEAEDDVVPMVVVENNDDSVENVKSITREPKRKTAVHPPTSEMVLESFKSLRKRNGTSAEEICKFVEENYRVNINRVKPHINRFLQNGVVNGLFEQVSANGKFKIKKAEKNRKVQKVTKKAIKKGTGEGKKVAGKITKAIVKTKKITRKGKNDNKVVAKKNKQGHVK